MSESEDDNLDIIEETDDIQQNNETEEATENQENGVTETDNKKEGKIKRVRNPQPKLNTERLKGPRGLQMLQNLVKDVKFKGRGHEEEDLGVIMKNYEYWCHRLYPKFPFDDCLERMEKLGAKRPLQTYLKKIRMDLLLDDDVTEQQQRLLETATIEDDDISANSFDDLLPEQIRTHTQPTNTGLTEEQLQRIRINRERAQRVRQQMLITSKVGSSCQNSQVVDKNVSSRCSDMHNILNDSHFQKNTSTNQILFPTSIEGAPVCFQTVAVVHESCPSPKKYETSDLSLPSETANSKPSVGPYLDVFGVREAAATTPENIRTLSDSVSR